MSYETNIIHKTFEHI